MDGWQLVEMCKICGGFAPDCGHKNTYPRWSLLDDKRSMLAMIEQFYEGGPYYGLTPYGRTGPFEKLEACRDMCITMLEAGPETT
jgi:hypothetical protein